MTTMLVGCRTSTEHNVEGTLDRALADRTPRATIRRLLETILEIRKGRQSAHP